MLNFDDLFKRKMTTPISLNPFEEEDIPSLLDEYFSADDTTDGDGDAGEGGGE